MQSDYLSDVVWYNTRQKTEPLRQSKKVDVVVVGGGMAGITAADSFRKKGVSVMLLEKSFCGAGASGRSSGFITPDCELSLADLVEKFGETTADRLWNFIIKGVTTIQNNIEDYKIDCHYALQDTLVLATSKNGFADDIKNEHKVREKLGYKSILIEKSDVGSYISSEKFFGGICYPGSFGIGSFEYCQQMKEKLIASGVSVHEDSPVVEISDHIVKTAHATVEAEYVVICVDRFLPGFKRLADEIYHVQTFLAMSTPLSDTDVRKIFPDRNCMAWDTDLIYHYFRIGKENRLLLGGADLFSTYSHEANYTNNRIYKHLSNYAKATFPHVAIDLEYMWPGLIGITKDIMPISGRDKDQPSLYYIAGSAGLPWAAALGMYAAETLLDNNHEFDSFFSPYRSFPVNRGLQKILGKKLSFAISNFSVVGTL